MRPLSLLLAFAACTEPADTAVFDTGVDPVDAALCEVFETVSADTIVAAEYADDAPTTYIHAEAKRVRLAGDSPPYSGYIRIDVGEDGMHAFGMSAVVDFLPNPPPFVGPAEDDGVEATGCDLLVHRVEYPLNVGVYWPYIESVAREVTLATVVVSPASAE